MVTRWVKWQSQFNDIALSSSHYLSNSFHSIDIFNISRVYDFPQAAILIFFISAVIIGILSLYRYRDLPAVQLGILCVLPFHSTSAKGLPVATRHRPSVHLINRRGIPSA